MFARVELASARTGVQVLAVPDSAVLDTGTRQLVLVQREQGKFEPRTVKTGIRADSYIEVVEGVKSGENVVVSANFLIDAESNLKAVIGGMSSPPMGDQKAAIPQDFKATAPPTLPAKISPQVTDVPMPLTKETKPAAAQHKGH